MDLHPDHVAPVTCIEGDFHALSPLVIESFAKQLAAIVRKLTNDLGYAQQRHTADADRIATLTAERDEARARAAKMEAAIKALLACPCIADRDDDPEWSCAETVEAEHMARAALRFGRAPQPVRWWRMQYREDGIDYDMVEGFGLVSAALAAPQTAAPDGVASRDEAVAWLTMEAAPRDGTEFLAWGEGGFNILHWERSGGGGFYNDVGDWFGGGCAPRYWRPLAAPQGDSAGTEG